MPMLGVHKHLNQTAKAVTFLAKRRKKTAPARRWLGERYVQ
tara:strand:- start:806 stop:928 length:123 start_codon:yes stop_codon:yes gene_type:complete